MADPVWLPTAAAARELGVHKVTLKKYGLRDGFLVVGEHFLRGPYPNSPRRWNVEAIRQAMHQRGMTRASVDIPENLRPHIEALRAKKAGRDQ